MPNISIYPRTNCWEKGRQDSNPPVCSPFMFPSSLKRLQGGQDPRHGTFVQFKLHPSRHLFRFLFHLIFHVRFMVVPLPLTLIQHLQHKSPDFFIIERQPYRASLPRISPVLLCQHRIDDVLGLPPFHAV